MKIVLVVIFGAVASFAIENKPFLDSSEQASKIAWQMHWKDEFDDESTIDRNWISENRSPKHILSSRWRENIDVKDGFAVLTNRKESRGDREWTSGSMTCKKKFKYGYFESKIKISAASGINNSFWLYQWSSTDSLNAFEIDIAETQYPNIVRTNIHDRGMSSGKKHSQKSKRYDSENANLYDDFHIYGLEWNENQLNFYFDGKLIRSEKNKICFQEAHLVLGSAVLKWAGENSAAIDNTSMKIDYVRIWKVNDEIHSSH
ncbi:MAG: glycoside hydrolase family 16 protein [Fibrobacter sp.]|nr:glycoside hydrolase family 16 protein [Fibrobacter sp.]